MPKKSKLLLALDAHQGRDYEAEQKKKQSKAGEKRKREREAKRAQPNGDAGDDTEAPAPATASPKLNGDVPEPTSVNGVVNPAAVKVDELDAQREPGDEDGEDEEQDEEDGEDEEEDGEDEEPDVPLSDLSSHEDAIPYQRLSINNQPALLTSLSRISLPPTSSTTPFSIHNSLISRLPPTSHAIPDPHDDLTRELEFYRVARAAVLAARPLLAAEAVPFARPPDYFAEMVKSDQHMDRIHRRNHDAAADRKGREHARRLRDARKFGKQVQIAREQERAKQKRDTLERINDLKRKRKGNPSDLVREDDAAADAADLFSNVQATSGSKPNPARGNNPRPGLKRQRKDAKFGFGGRKRFAKSGDAQSSADLRGFSARKMKGQGQGQKSRRVGKSRRAAGR